MSNLIPPLVTFFLFAYNQEKYIEAACRAALAQTYSPLEIIFSDDCSSDRTFALMQAIARDYHGPHQVRLNRNPINLGLIGHVNKSFRMARGDLIVVAAGDDISLPERVQCLAAAYRQGGGKGLVLHSSAIRINDADEDLGIFIPPVIERPMTSGELADCHSLYIGATAAWSRALYTEFGPIIFSNAYEDLVLGFRAAIKDSLVYVDKPLVRYRLDVGLSAKARHPIWKFPSRIATRRKKMKVNLDVYRQRLNDLVHTNGGAELKDRLVRNINFQDKRLLFYRNPLRLLGCIFSSDFIVVLRSLNSETKYLLGLSD